MGFIVGIDGPAGSGKGTVTKEISKRLGLINIDTGSTYRCVALETINRGIGLENKEAIIKIATEIDIKIEHDDNADKIYLNGVDVTTRIREKDVTKIVSSFFNKRSKNCNGGITKKISRRKKHYNGR